MMMMIMMVAISWLDRRGTASGRSCKRWAGVAKKNLKAFRTNQRGPIGTTQNRIDWSARVGPPLLHARKKETRTHP
jgi:hypothetical protein